MKTRFPWKLAMLLLCCAMAFASFALAEEVACQHPEKLPVEVNNGVFYKWDDPNVADPATQHAVYAEVWRYNQCQVCGVLMSGEPVSTDLVEVADHDFENGVCIECGYACPHPESYRDGYYTYGEETYENIGDVFYHRENGSRAYMTYCDLCGATLSTEAPVPYANLSEHSFYNNNGVCRYCDYVCPHALTYVYEGATSDRVYADNGSDEYHTVTGTRTVQVRCSNCDVVLSESTVPFAEEWSHSYSDGVCKDCGHICAHARINVRTNVKNDYDKRQIVDSGSNLYHSVVYDAVQYAVCLDCGKKLSESVDIKVTEADNYEHEYENGVCTECGHVNTCAHANLTAKNWEYLSERFVDTGDGMHHAEYDTVLTRNYCEDCHTYVGEETTQTEVFYGFFEHYYNDAGVCEACGYVNNCAHANITWRNYDWGYGDYTYADNGSDEKHDRYQVGSVRQYCPDCGQWFGDPVGTILTTSERHSYNDKGVCEDCGHVNACAHVLAYEQKSFESWTRITAVDNQKHIRSGVQVTKLYCPTCGMTFGEIAREQVDEEEDHDYDSYGICYDCGYNNTCIHVNVENHVKGGVDLWEADGTAAVRDAYTHAARAEVTYSDVCLDCGQRLNYTFKMEYIVEEHSFDDEGYCSACGYRKACAHENLDGYGTVAYAKSTTYKDIGSDLLHEASGVYVRNVYCLDCGEWIEDDKIVSTETQVAYHNYDKNGVCKDCGHVNACAHANTDIRRDNTLVKATDTGSNATHQYIGRETQIVYCKDCLMTLSETAQGVATYETKHNYAGDYCTECGHVNTCAHANTTTKTKIVGPCKDTGSDKGHEQTGLKFEQVVCSDCGKVLSSKLVSQNATEVVAHKYVAKVCIFCGHAQPAKSETAAQTSASDSKDETNKTTEDTKTTESTEDTKTTESTDAAEAETESAEAETEPAYEKVSESAEVNGVKVADHPTIEAAVKAIGESLDREIADGKTTVTIPGADKVLSKEEAARFEKLPVKDRLQVVLSLLGVKDSAGEMSDDAKALADDIAARIEAMTEAEKQELLDTLAKFFPTTKITIDGNEYDAITFDVEIDRDGKITYDRYTFYNDGEQWVLYSIEEGKAE